MHTSTDRTITNHLAEANVLAITRDGLDGIRLRTDMHSWIEARCTAERHVERGGLGCFGVGRMWGYRRPEDEDDPTWGEALIVTSTYCPLCTAEIREDTSGDDQPAA